MATIDNFVNENEVLERLYSSPGFSMWSSRLQGWQDIGEVISSPWMGIDTQKPRTDAWTSITYTYSDGTTSVDPIEEDHNVDVIQEIQEMRETLAYMEMERRTQEVLGLINGNESSAVESPDTHSKCPISFRGERKLKL